jgi:hypothetical protein
MDGSEVLAIIDLIALVVRAIRAAVRGVRTLILALHAAGRGLAAAARAYLRVFWLSRTP